MRKALVGFAGIIAAVPAILAVIVLDDIYERHACPTRWEKRGLIAERQFFGHCQVQMKAGEWLNEVSLQLYGNQRTPAQKDSK